MRSTVRGTAPDTSGMATAPISGLHCLQVWSHNNKVSAFVLENRPYQRWGGFLLTPHATGVALSPIGGELKIKIGKKSLWVV